MCASTGARATTFLRRTDIRMESRVRELSKGMVTQLHLALILAIDARLLVLDEPTLGLDSAVPPASSTTRSSTIISTRKRTILLTTHQVEEVENLLTDVIFINHGRVALSSSVEDLGSHYQQLTVAAEAAPTGARSEAVLRARGVRTRGDAVRGPFGRRAAQFRVSRARPRSPTCSSPRMQGTPAHEQQPRRRCRRGRHAGSSARRPHRDRQHAPHADTARALGAPRAVDRPAGGRRADGVRRVVAGASSTT